MGAAGVCDDCGVEGAGVDAVVVVVVVMVDEASGVEFFWAWACVINCLSCWRR